MIEARPIYQRPNDLLPVFQLSIAHYANTFYPDRSVDPEAFQRQCKATDYLANNIERMFNHFGCSHTSFILGLILLIRLGKVPNFSLTVENMPKYFACSTVIAIKTYEDSYFSNEYYARVSRMTSLELGKLQNQLIFKINCEIYVGKEEFDSLVEGLERYYELNRSIITKSISLKSSSRNNAESKQKRRLKTRRLNKNNNGN